MVTAHWGCTRGKIIISLDCDTGDENVTGRAWLPDCEPPSLAALRLSSLGMRDPCECRVCVVIIVDTASSASQHPVSEIIWKEGYSKNISVKAIDGVLGSSFIDEQRPLYFMLANEMCPAFSGRHCTGVQYKCTVQWRVELRTSSHPRAATQRDVATSVHLANFLSDPSSVFTIIWYSAHRCQAVCAHKSTNPPPITHTIFTGLRQLLGMTRFDWSY